MLMMFEAKYTLWHGGNNEPTSEDYIWRQACHSIAQFSGLLETHVQEKYGGIIRTVEITNHGTA